MKKEINVEDFKKNCQTGDILLYNTQFWYSKIIEYFSDSIYSHIGIILRDPIYINEKLKGLYLLESSYEDIDDSYTGDRVWGVQIIPLDFVLEQYKSGSYGYLYHRKLNTNRNTDFYEKLTNCINNVEGDRYNLNPVDWCKALFNINSGDTHKKNTFWCSALVAYVYCNLGYLNSDIPWTLTPPKLFSYYENEEENRLKYIDCSLEPEEKILF